MTTVRYTPVHRLGDGSLAAIELRIGGRPGSAVEHATALRGAARTMRQHDALDRVKWDLARVAQQGVLPEGLFLLTLLDPSSVTELAPPDFATERRRQLVSVGVREVLENPGSVLRQVAAARAAGITLIVDGVGGDDGATVAVFLMEPDLVMTDPELLRRPVADVAAIAEVLSVYRETCPGTVAVIDGVDSPADRVTAMSMGGVLGVGSHYPAVVDPADLLDVPLRPLPQTAVQAPETGRGAFVAGESVYDLAAAGGHTRRMSRAFLESLTNHIEAQASTAGRSALVLGTFHTASDFTDEARVRWHGLADRTAFAGVYGVGTLQILDGNVRSAALTDGDPLADEWNVVVLGTHRAQLLSARPLDRGADGSGWGEPGDADVMLSVAQTVDRRVVARAARVILARF
ncbi:DICT sensory domain-containing protein [Williamsia sterculiae]|nr:DICT sensory domain-containing protein [Williamsia sterculiae]